MAQEKKSFLLYCDLIHTFEELTDEEAGKLIKHTLRYVNDQYPEAPDRLTKISFEPIKQSLKRDLIKYEAIREKKRLAGLASAEMRKQNQQKSTSVENNQHNSTSVENVQHSPTHSTVIVSDSDSVSDSVSVIEKENIKEGENKDKSGNPISPEIEKIENPIFTEKPILPKRTKPQILSEADKFLLCIPKEWQEVTKKWLDYKKEKKESYKGQTSLHTFFNQLKTFSKGNVESAKGIINYSIANNYSGVFEPKQTTITNIQNGENRRFVDKTINHADFKL